MASRILITMADLETAVPLNAAFEAGGYRTDLVDSLDEARQAIKRGQPDVIIVTGAVYEPPAKHLAALARDAEVSTLALLEPTDSDRQDRLSRHGFTEALVKPVPADDVVATVGRLIRRRDIQERTRIVGESAAIQEVLVKIEQMAPVLSTVLIEGESGTGKELVAKAIHDLSPRRGGPFIAVNCAALPEALLESELFGHEKGAFTGAAERRLGRFELADSGTIFLDEIGEVSKSVQVKLLRVLESRSFFRVGGTQPISVDVRVVAATNKSLKESVGLGEFRTDLFYRLNVLTIYLPPLRERRGDIPILVRRFIRELTADDPRRFRGITAEAMQRLASAPWPGNVRQLRNLIESMVVLAPGDEIRASDIPEDIFEGPGILLPVRVNQGGGGPPLPSQELEFILRSLMDLRLQVQELRRRVEDRPGAVQVIEVGPSDNLGDEGTLAHVIEGEDFAEERDAVVYRPGMTMAEVEKAAIEAALRESNGNRRRAAQVLGIGERTLYRKLKAYDLG